MAIRLNLYYEVQKTKKQQQYDPLKLAMIGLGVIILCLAGYYFMQLGEATGVRDAYRNHRAELAKLTPLAKAAKEREDALSKNVEMAKQLSRRVEDRFYWGPVLEQLISTIPPHVQLLKCSATIATALPRRCDITLEGIAAGDEPRIAAEELRTSFADLLGQKYKKAVANFKNLEDGSESILLNGKPARTAVFVIVASFNAGEEPPPPPPPPKQPSAASK